MNALYNYSNFIARNATAIKTRENNVAIFNVPASAGGVENSETRSFISASGWVQAQKLWFAVLRSHKTKASAKRHAKYVARMMKKNPALADEELANTVRDFDFSHGNEKSESITIHNENGTSATGTISQLSQATGLAYERVKDLASGRRRYASGWAASQEEARRGRLIAGRPKKEAQENSADPFSIFDNEGSAIF